jgi:hypothetical protein
LTPIFYIPDLALRAAFLFWKLEAGVNVVYVLAVGKKERNVLRIAGEVVKI